MTENLTASTAAEILGVHPDTVRRWADEGKLPFWTTPGGQMRFRREDVEALRRPTRPKAASCPAEGRIVTAKIGRRTDDDRDAEPAIWFAGRWRTPEGAKRWRERQRNRDRRAEKRCPHCGEEL
jgi:excisionase family DNA binding protein